MIGNWRLCGIQYVLVAEMHPAGRATTGKLSETK